MICFDKSLFSKKKKEKKGNKCLIGDLICMLHINGLFAFKKEIKNETLSQDKDVNFFCVFVMNCL